MLPIIIYLFKVQHPIYIKIRVQWTYNDIHNNHGKYTRLNQNNHTIIEMKSNLENIDAVDRLVDWLMSARLITYRVK